MGEPETVPGTTLQGGPGGREAEGRATLRPEELDSCGLVRLATCGSKKKMITRSFGERGISGIPPSSLPPSPLGHATRTDYGRGSSILPQHRGRARQGVLQSPRDLPLRSQDKNEYARGRRRGSMVRRRHGRQGGGTQRRSGPRRGRSSSRLRRRRSAGISAGIGLLPDAT